MPLISVWYSESTGSSQMSLRSISRKKLSFSTAPFTWCVAVDNDSFYGCVCVSECFNACILWMICNTPRPLLRKRRPIVRSGDVQTNSPCSSRSKPRVFANSLKQSPKHYETHLHQQACRSLST